MRLFKYFQPKRTEVLRDGLIRFSSPRVLNDPFELKPHIAAVVRKEQIPIDIAHLMPPLVAKNYAELPPEVRALIPHQLYQSFASAHLPYMSTAIETFLNVSLPTITSIIVEKFEELIGILCLTEAPSNLLMWAHYADSHQGFVVEFDSESPFFEQRLGPDDDLRHIRKVVYRDERPSIILTEMQDFSPFLTKGRDWSYEAEWRMMMPLSAASRVIGDGPTAIHLFEFPKSMVRGVICGCRMTDSTKTEIRKIFQEEPEYQQVYCAEAHIDETHYRLNVAEVLL
jgi:hypothetical protein